MPCIRPCFFASAWWWGPGLALCWFFVFGSGAPWGRVCLSLRASGWGCVSWWAFLLGLVGVGFCGPVCALGVVSGVLWFFLLGVLGCAFALAPCFPGPLSLSCGLSVSLSLPLSLLFALAPSLARLFVGGVGFSWGGLGLVWGLGVSSFFCSGVSGGRPCLFFAFSGRPYIGESDSFLRTI